MPRPKATGSQGNSRPGPVSAMAQARARETSSVKTSRMSPRHAIGGGRTAARPPGGHVSTRPCTRPRFATTQPQATPKPTPWGCMLHDADDGGTGPRGADDQRLARAPAGEPPAEVKARTHDLIGRLAGPISVLRAGRRKLRRSGDDAE